MSDTQRDFDRDKAIIAKEERHFARMDYCDRDCDQHNEDCPYYDAEEEYWDYEQCFEDKGW